MSAINFFTVNFMRKFFAFTLICAVMLMPLTGCAHNKAAASVAGHRGAVKVEAALDEAGRLTVTVLSHSETPGIGDFAIDITVAQINQTQSVCVDAVAGATVSSMAVMAAADKAVAKLTGGDAFRQPVNTPQATEYISLHTDVIVVGAGGAGLTAAIAAAEAGARVMVIEKLGIPGGSTARSNGKIMAAGSELQYRLQEVDSPSLFAGYLLSYGDASQSSLPLLDLAEHSADNLAFLESLGVPFSTQLSAPASGQLPRRVHQAASDYDAGGGYFIQPMIDKALALGVEFVYNTTVSELLLSAQGVVEGVRGHSVNGNILSVSAASVILATGGFDRDDNLLWEYGLSSSISLSGIGNTGDGVALGRRVGAAVFDRAGFIATLEDLGTGLFETTGLIVDPGGARIADEAGDPFYLSSQLMARGYSTAYLIVDAPAVQQALRRGLNEELVITANSIAELGVLLGISRLAETVNAYNDACQNGVDEQYNKDAHDLVAVTSAPFCAVPLSLKTYGSIGGLQTNSRCQVVATTGRVIPGLYAAGEVMNGAYFAVGLPAFGASLAQVIETGRIAGKNAWPGN